MRVTFYLRFHTTWGDSMLMCGSLPQLGEGNPKKAQAMRYVGDDVWSLELEVPDNLTSITYNYLWHTGERRISEDWERKHHIVLDESCSHYLIHDYWQIRPADAVCYSAAFVRGFFALPASKAKKQPESGNIVIKVSAPQVSGNQYVAICGNIPALGNWEASRAVPLVRNPSDSIEWQLSLDGSALAFPLAFKFVICDAKDNTFALWETGENRTLDFQPLNWGERRLVFCPPFRMPAPDWRCAGTVIPLFSLRSEESAGIGDLGDLYKLVDWAAQTGQRVIQLLPVNDTTATMTWRDSYPYKAISGYALHPIYISLSRLGALQDAKKKRRYTKEQKALNALAEVDYEATYAHKLAYCRDYFEEHPDVFESVAFRTFWEENKEWLTPYAGFRYLCEQHGTPDYTQWGEFAKYKALHIRRLGAKKSASPYFRFIYFLQYVLDAQFRDVASYARSRGIVLKGDLPIGMNRWSVETWTEPHLFHLDAQAGAPPDDFSVTGQNWSFPTYQWKAMEAEHFTWWEKRFRKMGNYFDAFRIDHILGFFRIWEIPAEYVQGLGGHFNPALPLTQEEIKTYGFPFNESCYTIPVHRGRPSKTASQNTPDVLFLRDPYAPNKFHPRISAASTTAYKALDDTARQAFDRLYEDFYYHRHNAFWKETALTRLRPLLASTDMLVCGEDLGMIPATVPEVMSHLGILTLEIERMPKAMHCEFTDMSTLPHLSVCTTSTHDMNPLRAWWQEDAQKTQRYYNNVLHLEGKAPAECTPDLVTLILSQHLASPSMFALIPLQDWLATDKDLRREKAKEERINVPADTNQYWRYRMHVTLEALLENATFNERLLTLIRTADRLR